MSPHPVRSNTAIHTATFEAPDSVHPMTTYGDQVDVVILSHDTEGDAASITVKIGKHQFPLSEIEFIASAVKRHQAAVKAWNRIKK